VSEFEPTLRSLLAAGHGAQFRASGDSMYPTIRDGDELRVVPCEAAALRRGDVILTNARRGLTAHRVVRTAGPEIVTRGDNAIRCDDPIALNDVLGRVVFGGHCTNNRNPGGRSATIVRLAVVVVRRLLGRFSKKRSV